MVERVDMPTDAAGEVADETAGRLAEPLLALSSTLRHRGIVHPWGRLCAATVEVDGDQAYAGTILGAARDLRAVVRFSRTLGLPEPSPDAFGIAVRMFDADGAGGVQDLLVLSSASAPGGRQVILPARGYADRFYSSITPFRIAGRLRLLGARPQKADGLGPLPRLDEVVDAVATGELGYELVAASPTGSWRPIGRLHLEGAEPADTERPDFNPFNQAGGLDPVGVLNGIRRRTYLGSQEARAS